MRKLTLESLQVESFATAVIAPVARGTVQGHGGPKTCSKGPIETYNVEACGDTQYFDCTLGCTVETNCICAPTAYPCM